MTDAAIIVDNLSKQYEIMVGKQHHDTLRDQIADAFKLLKAEMDDMFIRRTFGR